MTFAVNTVRRVLSQPKSEINYIVGRQLLRSATSVGANYRAACRAKSRADFISKVTTVEEECDESLYWLDLIIEAGHVKDSVAAALLQDGSEIISIIVSSIKTARSNS